MKSKIIIFAAILLSLSAFSQTKVGTIESDLIISKMPQINAVQERVSKYAKQLDSTFQIKVTEYKSKVDSFKAEEKL